MTVTVTNIPERSRYEASVDGKLAGFAEYLRNADIVIFTHTEVDSRHEGQGVAGTIAREVLDDVRRRGLRALLRCPFLATWVTRHPEYDDVLVHHIEKNSGP
jgi:predicted GNAT family acetyltransferase